MIFRWITYSSCFQLNFSIHWFIKVQILAADSAQQCKWKKEIDYFFCVECNSKYYVDLHWVLDCLNVHSFPFFRRFAKKKEIRQPNSKKKCQQEKKINSTKHTEAQLYRDYDRHSCVNCVFLFVFFFVSCCEFFVILSVASDLVRIMPNLASQSEWVKYLFFRLTSEQSYTGRPSLHEKLFQALAFRMHKPWRVDVTV